MSKGGADCDNFALFYEKEVVTPLAKSFIDSMDLLHELASSFEDHQLKYAQATFERGEKQLRERIALFVGALDKVGAIPLAVTAYLSISEWMHRGVRLGGAEYIGLLFIGFYLFAIRMVLTAQWMEEVALLYQHALQMREARRSDGSAAYQSRIVGVDPRMDPRAPRKP